MLSILSDAQLTLDVSYDALEPFAYALLRGGDELEHRRVPYEHEAAAIALRDRFGESPWTETVVRRINTARF